MLILPLILQGNITLERALASFISIDVVSGLDYARFITDTVVFILSVPIAFCGLVPNGPHRNQRLSETRSKLFINGWLISN